MVSTVKVGDRVLIDAYPIREDRVVTVREVYPSGRCFTWQDEQGFIRSCMTTSILRSGITGG